MTNYLTNLKTYLTHQAGAGCTQAGKLLAEVRELEKQQPIQFLLDGARLKLSFQEVQCDECGHMTSEFKCVPLDQHSREFNGEWVALVPAANDQHLSYNTPPAAPAVPDGWEAIHLKTGNTYRVTGDAINATNAQDGQTMVIYQRDGKTYVREAEEFMGKFAAAPKPEACNQFRDTTEMVPATANYPHDDMGREAA